MTSNQPTCAWWPYLLAIVLLGTMSGILFGGMKNLLDYRRSAAADLPINPATVHFFTKEYLNRQLIKLSASGNSSESILPSFHLFVDEKDIESLDSNLPASGKIRYVSGHLQVSEPPLSSEIQYRYRGGLPIHWLYDKKSFRVKLPPFTTYLGERQFNLVNPSTIHTVTDWISYDMARSLGLLTPDYFPVRVYVNNATNGLHFFLSNVDESFLRKNHRMPGSLYSGDTIYSPNPFGVDKRGVNEATYKDRDGISLMWVDERLWDKDASRNAESTNDRSDIQKFIEIMNESDPIEFMNSFENYFDKEKYYRYWGLDTLLGSYHHDNFHNHKLYFDPYKGKFEPIEWDIRFWSSIFLAKDLPVNPLLKQVKLNPLIEYERDQVTYELLKRFPVRDVLNRIDQASSAIESELLTDPFRHAPDERYGRFTLNKEVPFSMEAYHDALESLKLTYQSRHKFLETVFEDSSVTYTLSDAGADKVRLKFSITGNSPAKVDLWQIIPEDLRNNASISRIYLGEQNHVPFGGEEWLYPGRAIRKGNVLGRSDGWAILAFGREKIVPSPLHYDYLIQGVSISEIDVEKLTGFNAITGSLLNFHPVTDLSSSDDTASVHPWFVFYQTKVLPDSVVLSGEIDVTEDRIYPDRQTVKILPGTLFKLAKGRSLIFYGKVLALGAETSPIIFQQKVAGDPWGSIVIQGKAASGSRLSHVTVSGGSVTTQRLVRYPGQINIHDVDDFRLENCIISENHIGDDALHVAYSQGEINHCRFENTAFDALDMDIAKVTVSDSQFFRIGNDALDLMTSNITISNSQIEGAADKCISVGEESDVKVKNVRLHHCTIGIAVKDQSHAYLADIDFRDNEQAAIALYRKNPRYSVGGAIEGQRLFGIDRTDISIDAQSTSLIPADAFIPSKELPENKTDPYAVSATAR